MIPSFIITLHSFPLNANGKVDRKCLSSPDSLLTILSIDEMSENEIESELEKFWSKLLKMKNISCKKNFISVGANSLHLMLAFNHYHRLYKQFHFD
jgi:hypothetical protein